MDMWIDERTTEDTMGLAFIQMMTLIMDKSINKSAALKCYYNICSKIMRD